LLSWFPIGPPAHSLADGLVQRPFAMRQRIGRSGYLWTRALTAIGLLLGAQALAQESKPPDAAAAEKPEPASSAAPSKAAAEEPLPGEQMPPVYMLKDKDGRLRPVPGFSFEQFIELYKLKNQLDQPSEQPRATIESLILSGTVAGQRVELV